MSVRRLLLGGSGGSAGGASTPTPPSSYTMLYNGQTGDGIVSIGQAKSTDGGVTWTRHVGNPVIPHASAGLWYSQQAHAANVLWDGAQWVCYFDGYDGTNYRIGRATSTDLTAWVMDPGNPLMGLGSAGAFDSSGVLAPQVTYGASLSPRWKMWYVGSKSGTTTIGYADSSDGLTWTKHGKVVDLGASGAFDDVGVGLGCAILIGSTWTLFLAGQGSLVSSHYRAGYVTVPLGSEATAAAYSATATLATFAGNVTSLDDGLTYQSNTLTSVLVRGSGYVGYGTTFNPVSPTTQHEVTFRSTSADLVNWTTPTGVLLPLSAGTFDTISAENPSVIQA